MGANMAEKITRIKASDSKPKAETGDKAKKSKDTPAKDEQITRKVTVKAKNSENKKLAKQKQDKIKAEGKKKAKSAKKERKVPTVLKPIWWLLTPFRALGHYIGESFTEIRQVRWPSRKDTWKMTLSVIIYVIIIAGFIMLLDALLTVIFNKLLG